MNIKKLTSVRQILNELRTYADRAGNFPTSAAIERLEDYLENESLVDNDVPVKRMVQDVEDFRNSRINEDELLIRLLWMLEKFGAKVRDVQISDKIAKLAKELETKELDLAAQAISAEIALIEIPAANQASGEQDAFELFARDFLDSLWFRIEQGPGRGADAGRDLIAIGRKPSTQSQQEIKWLVSCKHFAHSSNERSVSLKDEINIPTRVLQAECDAFMGFYSTLPSGGLIRALEELKQSEHYGKDYFIFDKGNISVALLATSQQEPVLERYFPLAYRRKKRGQIEVNFELLHHLWQGERALRGQEALLRNDAAMVTRVWREFEVKVSSAQKRRDYLMQQLTEEEE